jgi:hypothetical protein
MAPLPIVVLTMMADRMELTILLVPVAQVDTVGMIFAIIPIVVVMIVAIVVAGASVLMTYDQFLRRARARCHWGNKRGT